ncbi:MAG: cytochrome P450 [Myxococcota bacterium]|jgi:cytochrome P450 family 142 subfamily A polypeptide 1|nr:cytochrome P450 [Myxococcota bacterium]
MTEQFGAVDLLDPDTHAGDPWPLYEWLREEQPMYWDAINELWCISRYDDIIGLARQPELYTSSEGNVPKMPADASFINMDGKQHYDRRKLVAAYFKPSAIRKMEQHIRDAVDLLIDEVIERGECDFVEDIAAPLPVQLIGEMTGIPEEYFGMVREWMDVFVTGGSGPDHVTDEVNEAFINFGALHMELVDQRRQAPQDDLLSIWVQAEIDGQKMDEDDLLFEHTMMMIGGSETARNAISGAVLELAGLPDQKALLQANPELCANAAEEATRWVTPFIRMSRTATQDSRFAGAQVIEGQELIMLYPAANRDPRKFDDPYRFDVERDFGKARSISFGYGHHHCIGSFLALAEAKATFQALIERMPDWRVVGEPVPTRSSFIRGLKSLPISFTPGSRRSGP